MILLAYDTDTVERLYIYSGTSDHLEGHGCGSRVVMDQRYILKG